MLKELLFEAGATHDFNTKNPTTSLTLLHESAASGDIKMLTTLLGLGQSPFQKDHVTGRTIAHVAAQFQKKEIFDFMIKRKFDPTFINAEDVQGNTALSITCDIQNWDLFKLLTSKLGSDMHQLNSVDGSSLLHRAAYQDNKETIEKLLSMKFKITTLDKFGNTALHWAASSNLTDVVKSLVDKKADVNAQNNSGNTPLHNAAFVGNIETVNILIEKKAIVNKQNKHLRTPLHEAASRGNPEVIDPLIKKGGTGFIDIEDENGLTALQIAINERQIPFALELLRQGANAEREYKSYVRNAENELALLKGTRSGDVRGVSIEDDSDCGTILHQAIFNKCEDLVEQLIQSGASISKLDKKGRTPLHGAVIMENLLMVQSLTAKGAKIDVATEDRDQYSPLIIACRKGNYELCEHLIKQHASTEFVDSEQKTPVHHAARDNHLEIVKLLVDNGASVSRPDSFRRSPLHESCSTNSAEVVRYLLSKGSDLELQDDQGFTPLHLAVFCGSAESAIALIEKGSNLNVKDKFGRTALLVASQAGKTVCGRILIQAWDGQKNGRLSTQSLFDLLNSGTDVTDDPNTAQT
jgi:ankyrin repeat protein